jgi:ankyrin repeat protein
VDLAAFEQDKPMKTKWLVRSVFLAGTMILQAQTNDLSAVLGQGLFEEEANRNLNAAISNYQSLAEQFDKDRQVAATAVFRLGECYRKLGQTNEAAVQYQRIVREFSDQTTLVTLSRQNLTGLGVASQPRFQQRLQAIIAKNPQDSVASTTAESAARAAELEAEAAALKTQIEHLSGLKREDRRIAIQQNFPNPVLTKLMQDLTEAEQKLAGLTNDYAPTDLHITRVTAQVNAINGQIDAQVDGAIKGLQAKMEADLNAAKALRDQSGPVQAVHAEASPVTDSEDQEIRRIQAMIQDSPDLINSATSGATPLFQAAGAGWFRVVTFLLDHGANINLKSGSGAPLHGATESGNKAMVELLLSRGADVNAADGFGRTALHIAAENGFLAVAEVLLAHHADLNARDSQSNGERTPLYLAAERGNVEMLKWLIVRGADLNARSKNGSTPLGDAASAGQLDSIKALLAAKADPDTADNYGRAPMSHAAEGNNLEVVKILLDAKADPNGGKLDAPLFCAIKGGNTNLVELLLRAGANPNLPGRLDYQITRLDYDITRRDQISTLIPLELAIEQNRAEIVKMLLQAKANPNGKSFSGTPLVVAVFRGDHELMKLLLANGADVNARRPSDGETVLHLAVQTDNRELIELLLASKPDVNVRDNQGKTPLDYAKANGSKGTEIAALLRQHGALDNLPHWDRITVSRPSANFSADIFRKGMNDWNQFTLLQLIYRDCELHGQQIPFPDLTRIVVVRPSASGAAPKRIKINLLNSTNGVDYAEDIPLEFGDVVEIPERGHTLAEQDTWIQDQFQMLGKYFRDKAGAVRLVVAGGQTIQVSLSDFIPSEAYIARVLESSAAQNVLTSGSDLSHVRITRRDLKTKKTNEWVLDCSHINDLSAPPTYSNSLDLLLRDGDVIEVPEK